MSALQQLRVLLGVTDKDELLSVLLCRAEDTILDIIGRDALPQRLISVQVQLAAIAFNRLGDEGEKSRSEGAIRQDYIDGLPRELRERLLNYPRRVGFVRKRGVEVEASASAK